MVSALPSYTETETQFFFPRKTSVGKTRSKFLLSEKMSGVSSMRMSVFTSMCEFVCERRSDRHRLAVVVDDVLFVPFERKAPDTTLEQRLVDDVRD